MSISSSDMYLDLFPGEFGAQVVLAVSIFIAIYFTTLKLLFGSFSIITILRDYNRKEKIKIEYKSLFTTREGLLYHIGRSQSRGDIEDAQHMLKELQELDKKIDAMEDKHGDYFLH